MTGGTIKSEPGFSPSLDAEFVGTGNDYIHNDPSGKHMRLNAHGVVKDKESGAMVYVNYSGVVDITPELGAILQGHEDAKSTEFGNSCKLTLDLTTPAFFLLPLVLLTIMPNFKSSRYASKPVTRNCRHWKQGRSSRQEGSSMSMASRLLWNTRSAR